MGFQWVRRYPIYRSINLISFCIRKTTVAIPTGDDEMVGAEYLPARIASVTLGYALPTRHLLAAVMAGARDPVPAHHLMVLRGPDAGIAPPTRPEQARVVIVLGGVGVFLLKFRYQSRVLDAWPFSQEEGDGVLRPPCSERHQCR